MCNPDLANIGQGPIKNICGHNYNTVRQEKCKQRTKRGKHLMMSSLVDILSPLSVTHCLLRTEFHLFAYHQWTFLRDLPNNFND